jgi:hypothetical protein
MREAAFFRIALPLALMAHAAAFVALARLGSRATLPREPSSAESLEVRIEEVAVEAVETRAPSPAAPDEVAREKVPAPRSALATNTTPQSASSDLGGSPTVASPLGSARPSDSAGQPWTFSPMAATSASIGLRTSPGAGPSVQVGAPAGPGEAGPPSAKGAQESMRSALEAHDFDIGLSAGGPLVDPTRDAVRTSLVPDFAHAVLEFTTDEAGLVVSVRVVDSNSDVHVWDEVAQKITIDARKKPLHVPRGAQGLAVTMQVESKMISASGHDQREGVVKRIVGGLFDPTDLLLDSQDKPQRVVVARIVSERRL